MYLTFNIQGRTSGFEWTFSGEFRKEITGIYGPLASGKTTFLKCLAGILPAGQGHIFLDQEPYFLSDKQFSVSLEHSRIHLVWSQSLLFPHLSVEENLFYGKPDGKLASVTADVIDLFELRPLLKKMPAELTDAEEHRAAIVRAVLHEPKFLLLDEFPDSLTREERQKIISFLSEIVHSYKIPICYVSSSVSELVGFCEEVLVIENGRRVKFDHPEKVFFNEKFLSSMTEDFENILELPVKNLRRDEKTALLDLGGHMIQVNYHAARQPKKLKIGIQARHILISQDHLPGVSARNTIPAVIDRVESTMDMVMLICRVNGHRIWVEITPGSYRDLNLRISQSVYLIIKSRSISVFD